MRLAIPDMISNSYFPALAAVELGCFADQGLDVSLDMIYPVSKAYEALRDGQVDFVGGSAHAALAAFPQWGGVKLLCAQAQGMYWFLVMRADRAGAPGDVTAIRNSRIGAAPWVEMGLRRLLVAAGLDLQRDGIAITPIPAPPGGSVNFGLNAAQALESGAIDGFWANGMGAEVAVRSGVGKIILDIRRGDGPAGCFDYTFASVATTDRLVEQSPDVAAAAIRAIMQAQAMLRQDVALATKVGAKLFPAAQAALVTDIIRRDLPYYDPAISPHAVTRMNAFARDLGLLQGDVPYAGVVATPFTGLWSA